MHRLLYSFGLLGLIALAGCPPPPRYIVADVHAADVHAADVHAADVHSAQAPVQDALVAAHCGREQEAAVRTDDSGRARLPVTGNVDANRCTLRVAKPGYRTIEVAGVNLCTNLTACPPLLVQLIASAAAPPQPIPVPVEPPTDYAQPPGGGQ